MGNKMGDKNERSVNRKIVSYLENGKQDPREENLSLPKPMILRYCAEDID